MSKKGKGVKTAKLSERKMPKPKLVTQAVCQFCNHRAELQASSTQREGSTLMCYDHVGPFFAIWTGNATEFTVVKL